MTEPWYSSEFGLGEFGLGDSGWCVNDDSTGPYVLAKNIERVAL